MSVDDYIKKVESLDFEWYKQKKDSFKKDRKYVEEKGLIEFHEENYDLDGNQHITKTSISFSQYCFDDSIEYINPYDNATVPKSYRPIFVNGLVREIVQEVKAVIEFIDTNSEKVKYLYAVRDCITCQIEENKKGYKSEQDYCSVLDEFLLLFRQSVLDSYRPIIEAQDLIDWNSSRERCLYFNLNQDRLAALLFILEKAGFFAEKGDGTPSNFSDFLEFANEYFKVTNQKKHQFSKPSKLKDRYRTAKNNSYSPGYKYIRSKLKNIIFP